ncbi:MAG TPA: Na/Pi symporter [Chitinophagaceae bacterium]|nr:Na/Pi symporter [Chitinophagaceae bacterium]
MSVMTEIWKLLAGIALFMLGMNFLEEGLRSLVGRPFKLFLKKHTANKIKAIGGGALVTAVMQSSSVVNLMVLAFVGAGVITMQNALAVMMGANLGTTMSNWIVATIGFQFSIESFALPLAGIAGITMLLMNRENRWHPWFRFLFGFGLLFFGLSYIKTGVGQTMEQVDLSALNEKPAILFLLAGILITAIIQSSSATVAIVLSALFAGAISLYAATAIVLGSEIGTTIKLVLASVNGIAVKKRVALGNILFNLINAAVIFVFLYPINRLITDIIGIRDQLIALVFFQSLVNIAGIIIFYPLLNRFAKFLEKRFTKNENETLYIHRVDPSESELALVALEKEIRHFIFYVNSLTMTAFDKKLAITKDQLSHEFEQKNWLEKYEFIKQMHGEIHRYAVRLHRNLGDKDSQARLGALIAASRNMMYGAKNIKDAMPDIEQLQRSSNDRKYDFYLRFRKNIVVFFKGITALVSNEMKEGHFEELSAIYKTVQEGYKQTLHELHDENLVQKLNEMEFSTVLNFSREMYTAQKSLVFAMKDLLLKEKEADWFEELPGFIR